MNAFSHEAMKDDPKFKAFCARRINGKVTKPKQFKVPIPKPKSIYSVCGEYTTGRVLKIIRLKRKHYNLALDKEEWIDIPEAEREEYSNVVTEIGTLTKKNGEFVTILPDHGEHTIVEVLRGEPNYEWPPQDWSPIVPKPVDRGDGRWLKSLFAGKCVDCAVAIEKDQRALWFKEKRVLLCESCGKRSQKARYAS